MQVWEIKLSKHLNRLDSEDNPLFPSYLTKDAVKTGINVFDCFSFSLQSKERFFGCSLPTCPDENQGFHSIELPESVGSIIDENKLCFLAPLKNGEFTRQALTFNCGSFPVVLSSPHGGTTRPSNIPDRFGGLKIEEKHVNMILQKICTLLPSSPSYIYSKISRFKVDFNRSFLSEEAYNEKSALIARIHAKYHLILRYLINTIPPEEYGLLLDLHGFDSKKNSSEARKADLILGTSFNSTLIERNGSYWGKKELINNLSEAGFSVFPPSIDKAEYGPLSGGMIVRTFTDFPNISAIQLEISDKVRHDKDQRTELAHALAESLKRIVEEDLDKKGESNESSLMYT
ncbi:MAG: N-formylglutamate amidohydrolase [Candidatus Hodarchaeota archaeon]